MKGTSWGPQGDGFLLLIKASPLRLIIVSYRRAGGAKEASEKKREVGGGHAECGQRRREAASFA